MTTILVNLVAYELTRVKPRAAIYMNFTNTHWIYRGGWSAGGSRIKISHRTEDVDRDINRS
jgi:hypothetical protein